LQCRPQKLKVIVRNLLTPKAPEYGVPNVYAAKAVEALEKPPLAAFAGTPTTGKLESFYYL
jgi:hypothetical protein